MIILGIVKVANPNADGRRGPCVQALYIRHGTTKVFFFFFFWMGGGSKGAGIGPVAIGAVGHLH